jgi:hypothetical protein
MSSNKSYAVINSKSNFVQNTILWDGESSYDPGSGVFLIEVLDGVQVSPGFTYKDNNFIEPEATEIEKTEDQIKQENISVKQALLNSASQRIVIWQTKLLIGRKLSSDEALQLSSWLDYIDTLESMDVEKASTINWPAAPEY